MDEMQETVEHQRCIELSKYFREQGIPNKLIDGTDVFYICVGNVSWGEQEFYIDLNDSTCVSISTLLIVGTDDVPRETMLEACNRINQNRKWHKASLYEETPGVINLEVSVPIVSEGWEYISFVLVNTFMGGTEKAYHIARDVIEG